MLRNGSTWVFERTLERREALRCVSRASHFSRVLTNSHVLLHFNIARWQVLSASPSKDQVVPDVHDIHRKSEKSVFYF